MANLKLNRKSKHNVTGHTVSVIHNAKRVVGKILDRAWTQDPTTYTTRLMYHIKLSDRLIREYSSKDVIFVCQ